MMSSCPRGHRLPSVARRVALAAIVGLLVTPRAASADVVLQWNEIAVNAAIATGQSPFAQARFAAIVQVAVFTAVNAIGGRISGLASS